ncbi:MAG: AtpZ/AtpI family protein [Nocardioidaceae bacterium]|nr:AtpZ/AtpI family protein [Nocardioidaceae bacterium]
MGDDQPGTSLQVRDLLGIGGYVVACLVIGLGLGWWADDSLGTTPLLTLLGLTVGVLVGVVGTWLHIRPLLTEGGAGDERGEPDGRPRPY